MEAGFSAVLANDLAAIGAGAAISAPFILTVRTYTAIRTGIIICAINTHSAIFTFQPIVPMIFSAYGTIHTVLIVCKSMDGHKPDHKHNS